MKNKNIRLGKYTVHTIKMQCSVVFKNTQLFIYTRLKFIYMNSFLYTKTKYTQCYLRKI